MDMPIAGMIVGVDIISINERFTKYVYFDRIIIESFKVKNFMTQIILSLTLIVLRKDVSTSRVKSELFLYIKGT